MPRAVDRLHRPPPGGRGGREVRKGIFVSFSCHFCVSDQNELKEDEKPKHYPKLSFQCHFSVILVSFLCHSSVISVSVEKMKPNLAENSIKFDATVILMSF